MNTTIQRESFIHSYDEWLPLAQAQHEEMALVRDKVEVDIDVEQYAMLEQAGVLLFYSVRNDLGELVGYARVLRNFNPDYKELMVAVGQSLYIQPEYRGTAGLRLLSFIEADQRTLDTKVVTYQVPAGSPLEKILAHKDFDCVETVWAKWIGG